MDRKKIAVSIAAFYVFTQPVFMEHLFAYSESQFGEVTTSKESEIRELRQKEMNQLKVVLGRRYADNRGPEILLRLAELYIEEYRYYFFKENEIHQKLYSQGQKNSKVDHVKSAYYLQLALKASQEILKSRIAYNKMDQVYYFLGYTNQELARKKDSEKFYLLLVKKFPNSPYAPEGFRSLAEYSYENRKYAAAVGYFESASRFKSLASYPRNLYRLSWSYYKIRKYNQALDTMKRVVELSGDEQKFVGLKEEALNDLVMLYSEAGKPEDAKAYLKKISGGVDLYVKALERLSKFYAKKGDYKQALRINNALVEENGEDKPDTAFNVLATNVELYQKLNDPAAEQRELILLTGFYVKHAKELNRSEESKAAYGRVKNYLRAKATATHKAARGKKGKNASYSIAADLYGLYIKAFFLNQDSSDLDDKQKEELNEIRFYRSDALISADRDAEAMIEMETLLYTSEKNKYRKESGATFLNLFVKKLDEQIKNKKFKAGGTDEQRFLKAANEFEGLYPEDKLSLDLKFKIAKLKELNEKANNGQLRLTENRIDEYLNLIEKYPSHRESLPLAQEIVADQVRKQDYEKATKFSNQFLANSSLMGKDNKGESTKYFRSVLSHYAFSQIQEVEKDKDFLKAAQAFEKVAKNSHGDTEVYFKGLNNAAINYEKAQMKDDAFRIYAELAKHSSKDNKAKENLKRIALSDLWESEFEKAAHRYLALSRQNVFDNTEEKAFLKNALLIAKAARLHDLALEIAQSNLKNICPKSDLCTEWTFLTVELLEEKKQTQKSVDLLKNYLATSKSKKAEASFKLAMLYEKFHEKKSAQNYYEQAVRGFQKNDFEDKNYAARAAFILAEPAYTDFTSIKLELPEAKLKDNTRKKLKMLESLVARYQSIVSIGDGEWGIAALERLSDAFDSFANELDTAPVPPSLDANSLPIYRREIGQVVANLKNKSAEFLNQGYKRGTELLVTTPTFIALTQRLGLKQVKQHPLAHYPLYDHKRKELRVKILGVQNEDDAEDLIEKGHKWRKKLAEEIAQNPKKESLWVEFGNLEYLAGRLDLAKLLYEQALSLNPKHLLAIHNLAVVLLREGKPQLAVQGLKKAAQTLELNADLKLNLAKVYLSYHHFKNALDLMQPLYRQYPDSEEIAEAYLSALIGAGIEPGTGREVAQIAKKWDAPDSKLFGLWYNWSVWAVLSGNEDEQEDGLDALDDHANSYSGLEKQQIEIALRLKSLVKRGK